MTRPYRGSVKCPTCGSCHTQESEFERWMRGEEELDSRIQGIVRFDCDILLHRYKVLEDKAGPRDVQSIMFIEVKSYGADVTQSQRDTLSLFSQALRNRRDNIHRHKRGRHLENHVPPTLAWSHLLGRKIVLRMYGGHLLRMSHGDPVTSSWMSWNGTKMGVETLKGLLRFEIDPDSLHEQDVRRRSGDYEDRFPLLGY